MITVKIDDEMYDEIFRDEEDAPKKNIDENGVETIELNRSGVVSTLFDWIGCLFAGTFGRSLIFFGILLFSLVALFQLVTLPVEFDASNRALDVIENSGVFSREDYKGAKKVLSAAAMTYVAALVTTLSQILYYAVRFLGVGRRRD